tara:strand:- start:1596 stop:2255 length:660 start_codon:yes stop_codon:yes gene_type:complete
MILKKKDIWLTKLLKKNCYEICKLIPANKLKTKSFYTYRSIKKIKDNKNYNLVVTGIQLFLKKKTLRNNVNFDNVTQLKSLRKFKDSLFTLVKNNFFYSRFGSDKLISKKLVNKIYYQWLADSIKKKKEFYCIMNSSNKIISCIIVKKNNRKIIIDLTVSNKRYQGRGFSKEILNHIISKYTQKDIIVGTELKNLPALRLYKKFGFKQMEKKFVYHLHT